MKREKDGEFKENLDQLDLHGKTLKEAEHEVEMFLFTLYKSGIGSCKIITGSGNNVLFPGIKKYLENHALVRKFFEPPGSERTAFLVEIGT